MDGPRLSFAGSFVLRTTSQHLESIIREALWFNKNEYQHLIVSRGGSAVGLFVLSNVMNTTLYQRVPCVEEEHASTRTLPSAAQRTNCN